MRKILKTACYMKKTSLNDDMTQEEKCLNA
ncbi:hypothetical protein H311_04954, partial [Anncaliia algerae PRA109]